MRFGAQHRDPRLVGRPTEYNIRYGPVKPGPGNTWGVLPCVARCQPFRRQPGDTGVDDMAGRLVVIVIAVMVIATPASAQQEARCGDLQQTLMHVGQAPAINYILQVWRSLNASRVAMGCEAIPADSITDAGNYEGLLTLVINMCDYHGLPSSLYDRVVEVYQMMVRQKSAVSQLGYGDQRPMQCR